MASKEICPFFSFFGVAMKWDLLFIAIDRRTSREPGLGHSGDSVLQGSRPESLVEMDWPLVLVSIKQSRDNSSISSALGNLSYSRSF
jgi:hypothetical protein